MENVKEMVLVGYYNFKSKDKNSTYYVIQVLNSLKDNNSNKGVMINIFVTKEIYDSVLSSCDIGDVLNVESRINYETNKVYYNIVL